jgi:hypothetical protein
VTHDPAAGPQHAQGLRKDPALAHRKVENTVRDDHVYGFVRERQLLGQSLADLKVRKTRGGRVSTCARHHLRRQFGCRGRSDEFASLVQRHLAARASVTIGRKPAEDLEEPWPNGVNAAQRGEPLEGPEVGFLHQVFCGGGVSDQSEGQSVEGLQMRQREFFERRVSGSSSFVEPRSSCATLTGFSF